jgi:hypothetical protein
MNISLMEILIDYQKEAADTAAKARENSRSKEERRLRTAVRQQERSAYLYRVVRVRLWGELSAKPEFGRSLV